MNCEGGIGGIDESLRLVRLSERLTGKPRRSWFSWTIAGIEADGVAYSLPRRIDQPSEVSEGTDSHNSSTECGESIWER